MEEEQTFIRNAIAYQLYVLAVGTPAEFAVATNFVTKRVKEKPPEVAKEFLRLNGEVARIFKGRLGKKPQHAIADFVAECEQGSDTWEIFMTAAALLLNGGPPVDNPPVVNRLFFI